MDQANKKSAAAEAGRISAVALAAFFKRPQADAQIGAFGIIAPVKDEGQLWPGKPELLNEGLARYEFAASRILLSRGMDQRR